MSSAQVIRDCQTHFNPSALFSRLIQEQARVRAVESNTERRKRSRAKRDVRVKMGHGGTLDPLATGVLILGIGKGTKSLGDFLHCTKTYEAVVLFGASTDTYDRTGRVLKRRSYGDITRAKVEEALAGFRGKYKQMPPLYSALKMNGKPLYEYARQGLEIPREIETRDVDVSELELVEWYEPGEHGHRWPAQEADSAEQNLAERVWRVEKQQASGKKLSPEEEKSDIEALAAHKVFKRKAEEKQDELVYDRPSKRRHLSNSPPMMSGALGDLPPSHLSPANGRKKVLVPSAPAPNTPPPWEGKGPPAAKIRMTVSSGFYVRTLCHELGEKVGSAAMMAELTRTRQGDFTVGVNCLEFSDLEKGEKVWGPKVERLLWRWMNQDADDEEQLDREQLELPTLSTPPENEPAAGGTKVKDADSAETNPAQKVESANDSSGPPLSTKQEGEAPAAEDDSSEWNGFSDDPPVGERANGAAKLS